MAKPVGLVYFIAAESVRRVKIGHTREGIQSRLQCCRTHSPVPVTLLGYGVGSRREERRLHRKFRSLHTHGEWFKLTEKLREFIVSYVRDYRAPLSRVNRLVIGGPEVLGNSRPSQCEVCHRSIAKPGHAVGLTGENGAVYVGCLACLDDGTVLDGHEVVVWCESDKALVPFCPSMVAGDLES
jgi:hypothetical protein